MAPRKAFSVFLFFFAIQFHTPFRVIIPSIPKMIKKPLFRVGVTAGVTVGVTKPGFFSHIQVYIGAKKRAKKATFELFKGV